MVFKLWRKLDCVLSRAQNAMDRRVREFRSVEDDVDSSAGLAEIIHYDQAEVTDIGECRTFRHKVDVSGFTTEEIKISIRPGKVMIFAKHVEDDEPCSNSVHFHKGFVYPQGARVNVRYNPEASLIYVEWLEVEAEREPREESPKDPLKRSPDEDDSRSPKRQKTQ